MADPKFPMCSCGVGVCRKEKVTTGSNEGRYFFACPNREDRGGCNFHLWEDTLLGIPNAFSSTPGRVIDTVVDWDSSPLRHFKKMRIIRDHHGSEHFIPIATSPEAKIAAAADFPDTEGMRMLVISYDSLRSMFHQALQEEVSRLEGEMKDMKMKPPLSRL